MRSDNTRKSYKGAINQFFAFKGTTAEEYLSQPRNYVIDLKGFAVHLQQPHTVIQHGKPKTNKLVGKSVLAYIAGVASYLEANELPLPRKFWRHLNISQIPVTEEDDLSRESLRSILSHTDIIGKALFLLASSNGGRIQDYLQLKLKTVIDSQTGLPKRQFPIITQKRPQKIPIFITPETSLAIQEFLKIRESWLSYASEFVTKHGHTKSASDDRLFPISYGKANKLWQKALRDAGLSKQDEVTGRHTLTIHATRKYYRSQLRRGGIHGDTIELLLGHARGIRGIYDRYSPDELEQLYRTVEPSLRVFVEEIPDPKQNDQIATLREQVAQQKELIRLLNQANRELILKSGDQELQQQFIHEH